MMRKISAALIGLFLIAPATSHALILSPEARQQLTLLTTQLVYIMQQISQAQAQGSAYLNSSAFQPVAASIAAQISQIQVQFTALVASLSGQSSPILGSVGPSSSSCPVFYRDLEPSMQGDDVRDLQRFLAAQPDVQFNGLITGIFDEATLAGVQRFQAMRGVQSFGNWNTTGFGRVGPATRAAILRTCRPTVAPPTYSPIVPVLGFGGTTSASGNLSVARVSNTGRDMQFTVTANPGSSCGTPSFILSFGDGTQQPVSFGYSCGMQTQSVTHTYSSTGSYTATLQGGVSTVSIPVVVGAPTHSLSLTLAQGTASYSVELTMRHTPGARCEGEKYRVKWGNGAETDVTVSDSCAVQTRVTNYTYNGAGTYTIQVADSWGNISVANFTATPVLSAGAGDPYVSSFLRADGADGSTNIVDSGGSSKTWIAYGGAQLDTDMKAAGTASIMFDGDAYVTTAAHEQFNYDTQPFTIDLWFAASSFPSSSNQASLIQQSDSAARDSSLGGAGLVLQGDRLFFVGSIGGVTYHPLYNNTLRSEPLLLNTWYHAAVVRNGNTVTLYLNGISQGNVTVSGSARSSSNQLALGRYGEYNGNYFNGWLDEIRVTNGLARWTSNFEPQGSGGSGGVNSSNYVLLLHGPTTGTPGGTGGTPSTDGGQLNGDGSVKFVDSTGRHTVSGFGNAQTSSVNSKFGGSSMLFDGNGDYASIPDSADWDFGTGDFTVDFWTRFTSVPDTDVFIDIGNGEHSTGGLRILYFKLLSGIQVYNQSAGQLIFPWSPTTDAWYHVAIVRSSGVLKVFVNGAQVGSNQSFTQNLTGSTAGIKIGSWHSLGGYIPAYIDELRIVKGSAAWTSNFTPPTTAY